MGYQTGRAAIETRFDTQWADATPIKWGNQRFTPTPGTTFVEFDVVPSGSWRSLGADSPLHREIGVIVIQIYVPKNKGMGPALTLADTAAAIFRDQQFDPGITCRQPRPPFSIGEKGEWHVTVLEIPYYRNEVI